MRRSSARISANVELGHGDGVLARAVGDVDAALRGRGDIDRVVTGAGPDDERQAARREHRRGDRGAAHDEHVGARIAKRRVKRILFEIRLVHDLAAGRPKTVDPALLELVGDEDFHFSRTFTAEDADEETSVLCG